MIDIQTLTNKYIISTSFLLYFFYAHQIPAEHPNILMPTPERKKEKGKGKRKRKRKKKKGKKKNKRSRYDINQKTYPKI